MSSPRRLGLVVGLLLSVAALAFTVAVLAARQQAGRALPYRQSQATSGLIDGAWNAFGGTWESTGGAIRDDSNERGAKLITGSPRWKDYSVEGNLMLRSIYGYASDAGFVIRSSEEEEGVYAYRGYFAVLHRLADGHAVFLLGRTSGQEINVFARAELPYGLRTMTWYHVKLMAVGGHLAASVSETNPNQPATTGGQNRQTTAFLEADDATPITQGRAGLFSSHAGGEWREITISAASRDDLARMRATGIAATARPVNTGRPKQPQDSETADQAAAPSAEPNVPTEPVSQAILRSYLGPQHLTISGQVTLTSPATFVQDPSGGIAIMSTGSKPLKIGDEVLATGDVSAQGMNATMDRAHVRVLWEGTPMPAVSVTASRLAAGGYDGQYVEVEGVFASRQPAGPNLTGLEFVSHGQTFVALVPLDRGQAAQHMEPRSLVRLRGVANRRPEFLNGVAAFGVLVRSPDDLQVVSGPPWWSPLHLGLLACLLLGLGAGVGFLYRRVEKGRLLAVARERERLAYDMHDTLAQSVAGIGFQLEAIRAIVPAGQLALQKQLALAHDLVRHSHADARLSLDGLRPQEVQQYGLLAGLKDIAMRMVANGGVTVSAETRGTARTLDMSTNDALFRIGQEAIANAVRHACPASLRLLLEFAGNQVIFSVEDDGHGFSLIQNNQEKHTLGILSMHKRAEAINAALIIDSRPGAGTTVRVTAPLAGKSLWIRCRELLGWVS